MASPVTLAVPRGAATRQAEKLTVSDLLTDQDLTCSDLELLFRLTDRIKSAPGSFARALAGKQLAMIFEKPSLRTRVTFEVAMTSMGGSAIYLDESRQRLGEREAIQDVARNLERWVDGIVARTFAHSTVCALAEHASVPVINALTDRWHPCQALADFFTLRERFGKLAGLRMSYVGDGNNVCHSLMATAAKLGVQFTVATPPGFEPNPEIVRVAQHDAQASSGSLRLCQDPLEAVGGAQAVYTDVWASMGQEAEAAARERAFAAYQVNETLMAAAGPHALFMHCLPAHRGQEVTDAVIDSPRSLVYDQAENRLHVQKALLFLLLRRGRSA